MVVATVRTICTTSVVVHVSIRISFHLQLDAFAKSSELAKLKSQFLFLSFKSLSRSKYHCHQCRIIGFILEICVPDMESLLLIVSKEWQMFKTTVDRQTDRTK